MTKSDSVISMDTVESCTQTRDVEAGLVNPQSYQNEISTNNYRFAITGKIWSIVREHYPDILPMLITRGAIFARMSPDQKQQLVLELQKLGYYVGELYNNLFDNYICLKHFFFCYSKHIILLIDILFC